MNKPKPEEYAADVRRVLLRWAVLLVAVGALSAWATCRMRAAAADLAAAMAMAEPATPTEAEIEYWTCSMHPEVRSPVPGGCPKCGMKLIPKYAGSDEPGVEPAVFASPPASAAPKKWYMCTMPECGDQGQR